MPSAWQVRFFSERVEEEILALPDGSLARFLRYAERMEVYGPDLGMPHTRSMGRGLFELRLRSAEGIARVFFCTGRRHEIVMLHPFIKKSQKAPARDVETARRRMAELDDE